MSVLILRNQTERVIIRREGNDYLVKTRAWGKKAGNSLA